MSLGFGGGGLDAAVANILVNSPPLPVMPISAESLRGVKLRSSNRSEARAAQEAAREKQRLGAAGREKKQNERLRACDLECWHHGIESHTFKTIFVSISQGGAKVMMAACWSQKGDGKDNEKRREKCSVSSEQEVLLEALEERVAKSMASLPKGGVFSKLEKS